MRTYPGFPSLTNKETLTMVKDDNNKDYDKAHECGWLFYPSTLGTILKDYKKW